MSDMQHDWLLEGRAVDDRGQASTWQWRDADGVLPGTVTSVPLLEALMREDFDTVFGHPPTRVAVAWLPACGVDSLYKLPTWQQALDGSYGDPASPDRGRRGLWVVDDDT